MASERCAGAGSDFDSCGGGDKPGSNNKSTYKSVEQCKNKIDNLKKRYKVEIQKMSNGGQTVSHWHWFKQIDTIGGSSGAIKSASDEERGSGGNSAVAKKSKRLNCSIFLALKNIMAISVNVVSVNAGAVLKGTNVSGIYGCHSGNNNINFEHLCYWEVISRGSSFMDFTAITFCEENAIPVVIFYLREPGKYFKSWIDKAGRMV